VKGRYTLALVLLAACRFGGTRESPYDAVYFPDAAADGVHVAVTTPSGDDDGGASGSATDDGGASSDDAGSAGDDGGGLDAALDDVVQGGGCSPTVAVCDPVHNTGCNPLQQCDISSLASATPTGNCVFGGGAEGGTACTASIFTESCPAKSTCVDGGCRQLCFCNADCPVHQCCSDHKGAPGFTLCGSCS
jgi:hypothetical protein